MRCSRQLIEQVRQSPTAPVFDEAFARGRRLSTVQAVDIAWLVARSVRAAPAKTA